MRRQTDRQIAEARSETAMRSAGGEPCLYMHGGWKNVSLNGSQLSAALRTAKTSQGNKIWHYYYYTLQLSITLSLFLCNTDAHVNTHALHFFPLKTGMDTREHKRSEACVRANGQKYKVCALTHTHTHTAKFSI